MKMKWFWLSLMAAFLGVMCSCSDDNDPTEESEGSNNTEVKGDYTATTAVKTVTLDAQLYFGTAEGYVVYESFNHKHELMLFKGHFAFVSYYRWEGDWLKHVSSRSNFNDPYLKYYNHAIWIEDVGQVSGLSDITEKFPLGKGYIEDFPEIQPNHGYAITFIKEGDEVGYLRAYIKSYTLDNNGSLASVTVQYQLY